MGWNGNGPVASVGGSLLSGGIGVCELEQCCRAPASNGPVGRFEILLPSQAVQSNEVLRGEEEWVRKLVAIDEKGGRESPVCVECTRVLRLFERADWKSNLVLWVQSTRWLETGGVPRC